MISPFQEIELINTGLLPPLISDYITGNISVKRLHKYPFEFSSFANIIKDKATDNFDRKLLVEVLRTQYSTIETSDLVKKNIEAFSSEKTFAITTAHQPCLFLGPLYFIYKISCVINIANQLKKAYPDYNFIPVFWLGSEDHDIEELNHAYINGKKIEWERAGTGAMGRLKTASLKPVIEELRALNISETIVQWLQEGLNKYPTFGQFTQYFIDRIFNQHGLVVIDQDDARLKRKFAPVIKDEVLNGRATEVLKSNLEFIESNYKLQAKPRDINFFYLGENYRERIIYNSTLQKWEVLDKGISFTKEEIVAEIEKHPERFSPNVIYRPLYQELILPNLAFTGGAGELNYWLELKPLFGHFKVNYPMLALRNSVFIINPPVQKKLEKLNVSISDFFGDVEQFINRYIKEKMSPAAHLNGEREKIEQLFASIAAKAEAADVTLKQSVAGEKQKIIASLENIESKIIKAEKRKQETSVNQIRSIHAALFPGNILQERRENFIPYYETEFISALVDNLDSFRKNLVCFLKD